MQSNAGACKTPLLHFRIHLASARTRRVAALERFVGTSGSSFTDDLEDQLGFYPNRHRSSPLRQAPCTNRQSPFRDCPNTRTPIAKPTERLRYETDQRRQQSDHAGLSGWPGPTFLGHASDVSRTSAWPRWRPLRERRSTGANGQNRVFGNSARYQTFLKLSDDPAGAADASVCQKSLHRRPGASASPC
jgi:hypothetical protein